MTIAQLFDEVWDDLAKSGTCDARRGREYERVKLEFATSSALRHFIRVFITEAANRPVQSFPHTDVSQLFDKGGE